MEQYCEIVRDLRVTTESQQSATFSHAYLQSKMAPKLMFASAAS